MAHINPPAHLEDFGRFTGFEMGLTFGQIVHVAPRTGRRTIFTNWARWAGRFVIERLKQVPEYDNTKALEQDVQTWLDAVQGQEHTTTIPIVEPTIEKPTGYNPSILAPQLEDGLLKLTIDDSASRAEKAPGDMVYIGNPRRLYKLVSFSGNDWMLTPGILPQVPLVSDRTPRDVTSINVRLLTSTAQYRAKIGRGGWDVDFEEAID